MSVEERLFAKIKWTEAFCPWVWTGAKDQDGYGMISVDGRPLRVHRVIYALVYGVSIPADLEVTHSCDTPSCCWPGHLFLQTHQDNVRESFEKGRSPRDGEHNGRAKITEAIARAIKHSAGSARIVAERFGVGHNTVEKIRTGRTWANLSSDLEDEEAEKKGSG